MTVVAHRFSIDLCKKNPKKLFIFGDNNFRIGSAGQAIIREQPNAIGLSTKKYPGNNTKDFFSDKELAENKEIIDTDIKTIKAYFQAGEFEDYVFPRNGVGTGLSDMQNKCPLTFCYITQRLIEEFEFNNIANLTNQ